MQRWQRFTIVIVVAWMVAVGAWANRSWTDTVLLVTPAEVEAQSHAFVCSAPLAAKSVSDEGGTPARYPPARPPCEVHGERRAVAVLDFGFGALAVVAVVLIGRRSAARARRDPSTVG